MSESNPFTILQPEQEPESASDCGCSGGSCGEPAPVNRRQFLKAGGALGASMLFSGSAASAWAAGTAASSGTIKISPHLIPADKQLPIGWLRSLWEQGQKASWEGEELSTIGMPIGGIGTGQLYLCGDGTLGQWEIFNQYQFIGHGPRNYFRRTIPKPVHHGFAVLIESPGEPRLRMLDRTGFSDVSFRGEYPVGIVTYSDPESPVSVTLEAFSPFIPLNAADSALPATIFNITIKNTSSAPVRAGVVTWLENPVAAAPGQRGWKGKRLSGIKRTNNGARIELSAQSLPKEEAESPPRETIVFADFESGNFGEWKVEGEAFGTAPHRPAVRLGRQQIVVGAQGEGFINSFHGDDKTTGKFTSPAFTVSRRYINFLIGGGNKMDLVGMRLLVEGNNVRSATGGDAEHLRWQHWDVSELEGKQAVLEMFDNSPDPWGHMLADQIEFADIARAQEDYEKLEDYFDFGTMSYATTSVALASDVALQKLTKLIPAALQDLIVWKDNAEGGLTTRQVLPLATEPQEIAPGETITSFFVLAWHFPNTVKPNRDVGHEYAARFADASAVVDYVLTKRERLVADTRKWRDTWYDSTLPYWLLDRTMLTADCLATGTTMWWKSGRFWAWEGVVCCEGTCTHVWNYAQTLAFLFPELERNLREQQDLAPGVGLEPNGLVGFRHNGAYAADGQAGTVLKAWREHRLSANDQFLRRVWPNVKKVIGFMLEQDANSDGIIENRQHNTYDIDFYGANTFVGALYLGALRAGEEMAREMGEMAYADQLRKVYEAGRKFTEDRLWNGEYFIQEVDLQKHPRDQYATGCLSDQMFGQNWAHMTGLGYLYDEQKVKSALHSVWKYNWAPDTWKYNEKFPPERPYTEQTEPGLFICTWPGSQHLDNGVRYRDEVWTGIEYQVASHMMQEGQLEEGLAICRAVHDRYHPARRNPYNEVECSDFYARAMASWGVLLALSGFQHHGPKGYIAFAPRFKPEDFRCAFTAAEGWGTIAQKADAARTEWTIQVRQGQLRINTLDLTGPFELKGSPQITIGGNPVNNVKLEAKGKTLTATCSEAIYLKAGETLKITIG